jgi:hypothetical protein
LTIRNDRRDTQFGNQLGDRSFYETTSICWDVLLHLGAGGSQKAQQTNSQDAGNNNSGNNGGNGSSGNKGSSGGNKSGAAVASGSSAQSITGGVGGNDHLLIWYGSAAGKTQLLRQAGLTNQALISSNPDHSAFIVPSDDLSKPSICHKGSIDLQFSRNLADKRVWIADVHCHDDDFVQSGGYGTEKKAAGGANNGAESNNGANNKKGGGCNMAYNKTAVNCGAFKSAMDCLKNFGLMVLHVEARDFDGETGQPLNPMVRENMGKAGNTSNVWYYSVKLIT